MKRAIAAAFLVLTASTAVAQPHVALRPIDRATVRVFGFTSVHSSYGDGTFWPAVTWSHGSGLVFTRDGLILTARHVVVGANYIAIVAPDNELITAARVVYADVDEDFAILATDTRWPHHFPLPRRAPVLTINDPLSASGYPIDGEERFPAATNGVLSRITNDGALQASIGVNPGNSGGPVLNARNELVAIVVQRDDQAENISYLVPIGVVLDARATRLSAEQVRPVLSAAAHRIATITMDYVYASALDHFDADLTSELMTLRASSSLTPVQSVLAGARLWDELLSLRRLDPSDPTIEAIRSTVLDLCTDALARAPHVRVPFSFGSRIVRNRAEITLPASREARDQ